MARIPPVKGTRDFYPEDMAVRNWITEGWRGASVRNGFVEYDGPIFEHLQLFTEKSGQGIASELFAFTDRGGRDLAIRPEMTPTLARMVNQKINALARPIKWFSMPRCCRAERPQKGRLREFFQWNIDIIGDDSVLADAEVVYTAIDYLRSVGLTPADVAVRISSRSLLAGLLEDQGFGEDQLQTLYALLDKRPKVSGAVFAEMAAEKIPDRRLRDNLMNLQALSSLEEAALLAQSKAAQEALAQLQKLFGYLGVMGVAEFCQFDITIVRGLAYYTGVVFEIFDRAASLRAIGAGGRYDNLLAGLGGSQQVTGTGMGMGDVVLGLLLQEKNLLKTLPHRLDFFVIDADGQLFEKALEITAQLRAQGFAAAFSYKRAAVGKQFKQADAAGARYALVVGEETTERSEITLKDLTAGQAQQTTITLDLFWSQLAAGQFTRD